MENLKNSTSKFHQFWRIITKAWEEWTYQTNFCSVIKSCEGLENGGKHCFFILWIFQQPMDLLYMERSLQEWHTKHLERVWIKNFCKGVSCNSHQLLAQVAHQEALCVLHCPVLLATDHFKNKSARATHGRKNCRLCTILQNKEQKTPWRCCTCDIPLCLQLDRNCFQMWHTAECDKFQDWIFLLFCVKRCLLCSGQSFLLTNATHFYLA